MYKCIKILLFVITFTLVLSFTNPNNVSALTQLGQSADLVVGQSNLISNSANWGGPTSIQNDAMPYFVNNKMITVGWDQPRVLIWNNIPTNGMVEPDIILGQPDSSTYVSNNGGTSAKSLVSSNGIYSDGTRLFISDWGNNRILVWNTIPTTSFKEADYVLGQPDFITNSCAAPSSTSLCHPNNIVVSGGKFIVADGGNHRVLIWNSIPTSNLIPADHVLGQPVMTSNTVNNGGLSNKSMSIPDKLYVHNGQLFISEWANHRVLVFNSIPNTDFASADFEIGQPGFVTNGANQGGLSSSSIETPGQVTVGPDNKLYVVDRHNHRVLVFNTIPSSNGASANYVLGQPDFVTKVSQNGGLSDHSLTSPDGIATFNSKLYVSDGANRILVYDSGITSNFESADHVIGQNSFTENIGLQKGLYYPEASLVINGKLVLADGNARVLIYDGFPNVNLKSPTYVIGQPDLFSTQSNNGGISNKSLSCYSFISTDGTRLFVSDLCNNRVLIYNHLPTSNFAEADLVLGQPNMSSNSQNNGGISASTLYYPEHVFSDGTKLVVTDYRNNRVLIWNTFPTSNGQAADVVIGQPNMSSNTANNGGISAKTLNSPYDAIISNNKLIVSDCNNTRVLIFNSIPETNFAEADVVIGQEAFNTADNNHGGLGDKSIGYPTKSIVDEYGHLWVMDANNQRALMYDSIPTSNYAPANVVIGQPDFVSAENDWDGLALSNRIEWAESLGYWNNKLLLPDGSNNRVLIFKLGPKITSIDASDTLSNGSATITTVSSEATFMKVSTDPNFTGATWIPYQSTYTFSDFTSDTSLKHLYVKFKASNYEYETDTYSFEISNEGTPPSKVVIKSIGLIPNVPNKDSLTYNFTSQTPTIKGTSDIGTTVYFKISDHTYTTTTGLDGKFSINLSNPSLPRGTINITYYAVDSGGRKSSERTLKLIIGEENFPVRSPSSSSSSESSLTSSSSSSTSSMSSSSTSNASLSSTSSVEVIETMKEITIKDENGNVLPNTKVTINGKPYTTDSRGRVKAEVAGVYVIEYDKGGVKYSSTIKSSESIATLKSQSRPNILIYIVVCLGGLILLGIFIVVIKKRKDNI